MIVGVPTAIHIMFVWVPALSTVVLSFTEWDGLEAAARGSSIGFSNYWQVFTVFDNKFFPALFNNVILLVFLSICSAIGMLFAYLLDKNIRGSAIYQSVFYMPVVLSLAVVGFIWKSVMCSPRQGLFNVDPRAHGAGRPDRLGRQRREDLHVPHAGPRHAARVCRRTSPRSWSPWRGGTSAT